MSKKYQEYWDIFYKDVSSRDNFKESHKIQLDVLCNLFVEMHRLEAIILEEGYTYESHGRNGSQIKARPEVLQLNRVRSEIRAYSRMLGILLVKDTTLGDPEEDDWD